MAELIGVCPFRLEFDYDSTLRLQDQLIDSVVREVFAFLDVHVKSTMKIESDFDWADIRDVSVARLQPHGF